VFNNNAYISGQFKPEKMLGEFMDNVEKKVKRASAEAVDQNATDDMEKVRFVKINVMCPECLVESGEKVKFTLSKGIPNFITCKSCGDTYIYMKEFVARESTVSLKDQIEAARSQIQGGGAAVGAKKGKKSEAVQDPFQV
jgi:transposase-like protein